MVRYVFCSVPSSPLSTTILAYAINLCLAKAPPPPPSVAFAVCIKLNIPQCLAILKCLVCSPKRRTSRFVGPWANRYLSDWRTGHLLPVASV